MKRVLTSVPVILLLLGAAVWAGPTITVDSDTYEFGSVVEGYSVTHTFTLQNVGDEELVISRIRVSCGCTATKLATDHLAPGESVDFTVTVNTTGFNGTIVKSIYVYSNDPERERPDGQEGALMLYVRGTVLRGQYYHTSAADLNYLFYTLIDLRDPEAFATGHLIGAVNVQPEEVADWVSFLPIDSLILLIDQAGEIAPAAADDLAAAGYTQTRFVTGGMSWWVHVYGTDYLLNADNPLSDQAASGNSSGLALQIADMKYLFYGLIDLRSPEAYVAGHLVGAINIPFLEIQNWMDILPKDAPLFLYDDTGVDADAAVQVLLNAGFNEARSLLGGLAEWNHQYENRFILSP